MKATVVAPANIALIKYWGKADDALRIPLNDSISMNLSGAHTTTTVEFSRSYQEDEVYFLPESFDKNLLWSENVKTSESEKVEKARIAEHLDRVRARAGTTHKAKVVTRNSFPKGAGAASSASGFAALTVAAFAAAGVLLSEKELTIFARQGSGSACRSVPDGFVIWEKGSSSDTSYAHSLYPHAYWDIGDLLVIVDSGMKEVSTTEGMKTITTSPKLAARLAAVPIRMERMKKAFVDKNFRLFGEIMEEDCLNMHAVMQTQIPALDYWNDTTRMLMDAVRGWRNEGLPVYFTIDAGPNVHVMCEEKDEAKVLEKLKSVPGIESTIRNKPAPGAHLSKEHLF